MRSVSLIPRALDCASRSLVVHGPVAAISKGFEVRLLDRFIKRPSSVVTHDVWQEHLQRLGLLHFDRRELHSDPIPDQFPGGSLGLTPHPFFPSACSRRAWIAVLFEHFKDSGRLSRHQDWVVNLGMWVNDHEPQADDLSIVVVIL